MKITVDIPQHEAAAVERLLACVLARYSGDLSSTAKSGAVRVRQAFALALTEGQELAVVAARQAMAERGGWGCEACGVAMGSVAAAAPECPVCGKAMKARGGQ